MNNNIEFNLTEEMKQILLKYNNIKCELKNNYLNYNENEIKEKEKELDEYRKRFIYLFKFNNEEEILNYLYSKED